MSDDIIGLLLDDSMPPRRLGALLRAARKRRGLKRHQAAAAVDTTSERLRAYERGELAVPADVCLRLVECYGEHLTRHVPTRTPPELEGAWLMVAGAPVPRTPATSQDVLRDYAELVRRLRGAKRGQPLTLRASDLKVLGAALEIDAAEIEQRVADVLGCSRDEARSLHREILRRKVVLPVAGLAAGVVALAGVTNAHAAANAAPELVTTTTPGDPAPTTTTVAPPAPPTAVAVAATPPEPSPTAETTPAPEAPRADDDDAAPAVPGPAVDDTAVDDTTVGVLPGETPITIIETPATPPES